MNRRSHVEEATRQDDEAMVVERSRRLPAPTCASTPIQGKGNIMPERMALWSAVRMGPHTIRAATAGTGNASGMTDTSRARRAYAATPISSEVLHGTVQFS
jgi:hypothetical protein